MIEFIDKTNEQSGTPVNRETLMALQGFITADVVFENDSKIVEKNDKNQTLTTIFYEDGSIVEVFEGEKTITKITTFENDGKIKEVIT